MYLGRTTGRLKAVDDKTIYAQPRLAEVPVVAKLEVVAASVVAPEPVLEGVSAAEADRLRDMNSTLRGRLRTALGLLREKNRTIARLSKENAALREPEQLTVEAILSAESVSSRS